MHFLAGIAMGVVVAPVLFLLIIFDPLRMVFAIIVSIFSCSLVGLINSIYYYIQASKLECLFTWDKDRRE